jgi:hypothetical protein
VRTNPKRQRRHGGGKPFSLILANRDLVQVRPTAAAPAVTRELIATGARHEITESQAYAETLDYFYATNKRPQTEALRAILAAGHRIVTRAAIYWQEA